MRDYVFFDLDGTLTDPYEGITNSVIYALGKSGVRVSDKAGLKRFIGPPLHKSFMSFCGFDEKAALQAVNYYREYFSAYGMFENKVYCGVEEMLSRLLAAGKVLAVATSKPQTFAKKILSHFNLSHFFSYVSGATLDSSRTEKGDILAYALKNLHIAPDVAVMVGDREYDIIGAKASGLESVGVLYGYGSEAELVSAGADHLARTPQEVAAVILS